MDKTIEAAKKCFAVNCTPMKSIQGQIAADGRKSFSKGVPSSDAVWSFRACHRELTYRTSQCVSLSRLEAEKPSHIASLRDVIVDLQKPFPVVFLDPRKIWNWDETAVCGEYGRNFKCFTSSLQRQGGSGLGIKDAGKHLTAGLAVTACGNIAPLF